jgi:hypothetical protein
VSIFSNPSAGAKDDPQAYIAAILGLLGDADPVEVLRTTPAWCDAATAGLSAAQLSFREAPGKWSIGEILQHLADSELMFGYRVRRVLAEDRPPLPGFDQDLWANQLNYSAAPRDESLAVLGSLRAQHVRMFEGCSEEQLARFGVHAERGEESIGHLMRLYAGHDLAHRKQIERVKAAALAS